MSWEVCRVVLPEHQRASQIFRTRFNSALLIHKYLIACTTNDKIVYCSFKNIKKYFHSEKLELWPGPFGWGRGRAEATCQHHTLLYQLFLILSRIYRGTELHQYVARPWLRVSMLKKYIFDYIKVWSKSLHRYCILSRAWAETGPKWCRFVTLVKHVWFTSGFASLATMPHHAELQCPCNILAKRGVTKSSKSCHICKQ
jgi:hypothetical protein